MFSVLRRQFRRLSIQLTLWNALIFLAAALALLSVEYLIIERGLRAHERTAIESKLNQYAGEYHHGGLDAVRRIASFKQNQEIRPFFVRIADAQNRTLFLRDPEEWVDFAPDRLAEREPVPPQRGWLTLNSRFGPRVLIAFPIVRWCRSANRTRNCKGCSRGFATQRCWFCSSSSRPASWEGHSWRRESCIPCSISAPWRRKSW